jgi:hypothetical protein
MTSEEHYGEAERLLAVALDHRDEQEVWDDCVALAQVHAILSLYQPSVRVVMRDPADTSWIKMDDHG